MAALIVALYFQDKSVLVIEEAERNIHPYLISKIVEMMKDAARNKQIIVTTHNPELVRQAGIENLLLVTRDKNGFSNVTKPADKQEIRQFLQNEIGIEELYAKNLLEV
jgi:predicted ATPase